MTFMRHTPFYHQQAALGAEFVDRFGFAAAYHYGSIEAEHRAAREGVGIFDVYGQTMIDVQGSDALDFLQWIVVNDLSKIAPGGVIYTSLCNDRGGMVDDLTIFRLGPSHFWLSPTPARVSVVADWLEAHRGERQISIVPLGYRNAYLSVQGPRSRALLERLTSADLSDAALKYFRWSWSTVASVPNTLLSRTGYSGELGYELFFPIEYAAHMWSSLFEAGADLGVKPCGLGALVTLRMEKRYPLYGLDLNDEITPYEAGLGWTVKLAKGDFIGRAALETQRSAGVRRKLVQLVFADLNSEAAIGDAVHSAGAEVGRVTSVAKGHSLGRTLALAYVAQDRAVDGNKVHVLDKMSRENATTIALKPLYDPDKQRLLS
ncbi:MAG: glycine cleavage system aminomethyltransferase GcvT [Proteobacteria bacterium]|nr:glycine cleavage system aminomethyltransferase GcvT [Pseudomonadota bacterium]